MKLAMVNGGVANADGQANAQGRMTPQPRLVRAAHEFEGQMMKELLKPLTSADALTGDDGDSDGGEGASGALGEFASEALGQALSAQGGFGIANGIVKQLSKSRNGADASKVTGSLHGNTVMRTLE